MTPKRHAATLADLPLYADDKAIGAAVLGPERSGEWVAMAPLLENRGLPKIDALHGGRYVPSVARWYEYFNGVTSVAPSAPRGIAKPEALSWRRDQKRPA